MFFVVNVSEKVKNTVYNKQSDLPAKTFSIIIKGAAFFIVVLGYPFGFFPEITVVIVIFLRNGGRYIYFAKMINTVFPFFNSKRKYVGSSILIPVGFIQFFNIIFGTENYIYFVRTAIKPVYGIFNDIAD